MVASRGAVASELLVETAYAWRRLAVSLALSTIGGVGLWSVVVVLPAVQAEFGVARGSASLPYTATMLGFALGGILMGRLADRFGVIVPLFVSSISLGLGYLLAAQSAEPRRLRADPGPPHRPPRQLRHVRPAGGRRLPLVHAPPRHRGLDLRQRQLPRRHRLAPDPPALHRDAGLAANDGRRRDLLHLQHAAADLPAPQASAGRPRAGRGPDRDEQASGRISRRAACRRSSWWPASGAASPCRCRRCMSWPTRTTSVTAPRTGPGCSR